MAKCKDCEFLGWNPVCRRWHTLKMVPVGDHNAEWDCSWFQPGLKPLVDELAEVARALLVEVSHTRDHYPDCVCDEECLEWARIVLCRHDKEQDNAE